MAMSCRDIYRKSRRKESYIIAGENPNNSGMFTGKHSDTTLDHIEVTFAGMFNGSM